jgi:hypothetical protein
MRNLTVEIVRELFDYNPETGHLTYKVNRGGHVIRGHRAGSTRNYALGHRRVAINKKVYGEHNVIWLHYYGETVPEGKEIDHINHDGSDNRIANLRAVTNSQNKHNRRLMKHNKTSGITGVCFGAAQGKWMAYIMIDRKNKYLGLFDTKEEAIAARREAELRF